MLNKTMLLLVILGLFSCNKYEVPYPDVQLKIHIENQETGAAFANCKGILRTSDFFLSSFSPCYYEDPTTIEFDSTFSDENGDFKFTLPFLDSIVPQGYYELVLIKDNQPFITVNNFIQYYVQCDTFSIGDLTRLDVLVQNNPLDILSFSALGYKDLEAYKIDSTDAFNNPDLVTRLGNSVTENDYLSTTLPFLSNKYVALQIIDQSTSPPVLINYDLIKMEKDSIITHIIQF